MFIHEGSTVKPVTTACELRSNSFGCGGDEVDCITWIIIIASGLSCLGSIVVLWTLDATNI